jgi:NAD(P)-dependent dehydrogenase (short-subunit alcohol dehydrogenase family)
VANAGRSLLDKRALVTGGSSGIGRAVTLGLAAEGARVAVCGRDPVRTEAVRQEVDERTSGAVALTGDVAIEAEAERIVEAAAGALGGLDILVNNAGIDMEDWCPVHEIPVETWDRIIGVNLRGAFLISKAAIPHLLRAGGGTILHISSIAAVTVWAGDCAYDVSKAGLNMLSDHIAVEYAKQGIRSNTLMPGVIRTPLADRLGARQGGAGAVERQFAEAHPVGRLGTVEEVAEAALFLCSCSSFLTGARLAIDGGYSRV